MSEMKYRPLGKCGTKVSQFGLGGWTTYGASLKDTDLIRKILLAAFEAGVNFFDSADIYERGENEKVMGCVLRELPRHQLVVSSKVFWPMSDDINDRGLSRKHILKSADKTLQRMGLDYLDIYFCHRFDPETPLHETVRAMDYLVRKGKILYWGTSEWTAEQLTAVHKVCAEGGYYKPQVEQPQYNLLVRKPFENSVAPTAQKLGMGLVTWSPLASGMLTGKYDKGVTEGRLSKIDWLRERNFKPDIVGKVIAFKQIADQFRISRTQLALAWTAHHAGVSSVILGATSLEQLQENLQAVQIELRSDVLGEIDKLFGV